MSSLTTCPSHAAACFARHRRSSTPAATPNPLEPTAMATAARLSLRPRQGRRIPYGRCKSWCSSHSGLGFEPYAHKGLTPYPLQCGHEAPNPYVSGGTVQLHRGLGRHLINTSGPDHATFVGPSTCSHPHPLARCRWPPGVSHGSLQTRKPSSTSSPCTDDGTNSDTVMPYHAVSTSSWSSSDASGRQTPTRRSRGQDRHP
jgi:hypothetical protein